MSDVNLFGVASVSSRDSEEKNLGSSCEGCPCVIVIGGDGFRFRVLWKSAVSAGMEAVTMAQKCSS